MSICILKLSWKQCRHSSFVEDEHLLWPDNIYYRNSFFKLQRDFFFFKSELLVCISAAVSSLWQLPRCCSNHVTVICVFTVVVFLLCVWGVCVCVHSAAGVSASFGEMLLLVAMYFHSNQLTSIIELVCSTLGMKVRLTVNTSVCPSVCLAERPPARHKDQSVQQTGNQPSLNHNQRRSKRLCTIGGKQTTAPERQSEQWPGKIPLWEETLCRPWLQGALICWNVKIEAEWDAGWATILKIRCRYVCDDPNVEIRKGRHKREKI